MTIAEAREKCKSFIGKIPRDAVVLGIIVLASLLSFGLGYMAGLDATVPEVACDVSQISTEGRIVASKSGTKYYFKSCAGAGRITEANKITFISTLAAEEAGYSLASNCKDF